MQQNSKPDVPKMNITLTVEELNIILSGLGELQAKVSINLIEKIKNLWNESQVRKKAETKKEQQTFDELMPLPDLEKESIEKKDLPKK